MPTSSTLRASDAAPAAGASAAGASAAGASATMASTELSPSAKARLAGFLYLLVIAGGIFAQLMVRDRLVVSGDAAATAENIMSHLLLYRLGFATEVFYLLCNVPLTLLLFDVFRIVNTRLMVVTAVFSVIGTAIEGVALVAHYAPVMLLGNGKALAAFSTEQLQAAAYLSIRIFDYGFMIGLAFFGCFCIGMGFAIWKSAFFPRFVGVMLWIQGALYLINSFAHFISPAIGAKVFPFLLVSGLAELSFCLTLLIFGVNRERWEAQRACASH